MKKYEITFKAKERGGWLLDKNGARAHNAISGLFGTNTRIVEANSSKEAREKFGTFFGAFTIVSVKLVKGQASSGDRKPRPTPHTAKGRISVAPSTPIQAAESSASIPQSKAHMNGDVTPSQVDMAVQKVTLKEAFSPLKWLTALAGLHVALILCAKILETEPLSLPRNLLGILFLASTFYLIWAVSGGKEGSSAVKSFTGMIYIITSLFSILLIHS
ncbi:hypothetical protein [Magnetospirillum sp. SS-4]|uniref:hypothetical protein n=1 Tax=Magnetospirillum sp. SS-4 TaxID=2681465 RepID=UPI001385C8E1|nr:hypothetical protein [Magnetospirillum sp. SS-4]CAA7618386.1 hypothetical protein MTBSS4_210087 [Magnetospirillum sp. SS-4]